MHSILKESHEDLKVKFIAVLSTHHGVTRRTAIFCGEISVFYIAVSNGFRNCGFAYPHRDVLHRWQTRF